MANDDGHSDAKPASGSQDVALIHGVTPEGDLRVLRQREDKLELGAIRPLREGAPIVGEVVRLTPRKEFPLLCDVTTELRVPAAAPAPAAAAAAAPSAPATPPRGERVRKGPPQVATDAYRDNWDAIWSRRKPRSGVLN